MMMRAICGRRPGALLAFSLLSAVISGTAIAAQISDAPSAFQACLDARFHTWLQERAELVLNEDPKGSDIDDASVAKWAAATLDGCRAQAQAGERDVEERFAKHMARWREHIYQLVRSIQKQLPPD